MTPLEYPEVKDSVYARVANMLHFPRSAQEAVQPGRVKGVRMAIGYPGSNRFADAEDPALLKCGANDIFWGLNMLETVIHPALINYW